MSSIVETFADLFQGRKDAYGTDEGGCWRNESNHTWESIAFIHLEGGGFPAPIGVYPMVPRHDIDSSGNVRTRRWAVRWACVDFDVRTEKKPSGEYESGEAAHEAALNLVAVLWHNGIKGWIERSRSGGRHVWVFFDEWVTAAVARRAMVSACEIAGASTREVNPKQETLPDNALGNYVRLPYPGGNVERGMLTPHGSPWGLESFVQVAIASRSRALDLKPLVDLYIPTPAARVEATNIDEPSEEASRLRERMGGLTYTIWKDGPGPVPDRSTTLYRLACNAFSDGFEPNEVLTILTDADARWGKFHARADCDYRLRQIIERAMR